MHLLSGKEPRIGRLEKRLCGKEGFSGHDICHLYISYRYAGFGTSFTERLYVPELCDNETLEAHGCTQESSFEEEADCGWEYLSGYAERLGDGSKMVVNGDVTQIDLPEGKHSGLKHAVSILRDIDGIETVTLTDKDVVRNPLVMRIVRAYDRSEPKEERKTKEDRKRR